MATAHVFKVFLILGVVLPYGAWCLPTVTNVNCQTGSEISLGNVDEGYTGEVDILQGIPSGESLTLEVHLFPIGVTFLKLNYTAGGSSAIVSTSKPLDADTVGAGGLLYYAVKCTGTGLKNVRSLSIIDRNDNPPIFQQSDYSATISETLGVGSSVVKVLAVDADVTDANNRVTYSIQAPVPSVFEIRADGLVQVKERLNYNTGSHYTFTVEARDPGGRSDTATVTIEVTDFDNMNPYFDHSIYEATIPENQRGPLPSVLPAAIKAQDGDTGINQTVTYSITAVAPSKFQDSFTIDENTGIVSVSTALDREEISSVNVQIKAAQQDDSFKTANALVVVSIEDINDNPPKFDKADYSVAILENSPGGSFILQAKVTDEDLGGFVGTIRLIPDTVPFSVDQDGTITVHTSADLDRETVPSFQFQVVAVDQPTDGLNATAQVNITVTDINDNNPEFLPLPSPIAIAEGKYTPAAPGLVCQIRAEDKDVGENGRVTISMSSYSETFTLKENGTLVALAELDRETQDSYDLVIIATDHGKPQRQNVTNIRVTITDVNDNAPVFSTDTYIMNILTKDSIGGDLVLTLKATDKDAGNNSVITYSFSSGASEYLNLNSETGQIVLTSDLSDLKEDILLNLTAKAEDHGTPPLSSTATVLIYMTVSLVFESPTYNFSLQENKPKGSVVGTVLASSSSYLFEVSYALKTHRDLFSVDTSGSIRTRVELDMEAQEYYVISVEATDTRTPPSTALTVVTVQVENVNEMPVFDSNSYTAEIFSIAPFKYPIVKVKATDPDVGESERLQYSLVEPSSLFAVEPSSGLVYVVSAAGESGMVTLQVKATDPHGLYATAAVEVTIKDSSSSDVVVISLNQEIDTVLNKTLDMKEALERALGWSVSIISISSSREGLALSRTTEIHSLQRQDTPKTYVSFIATDTSGTNVIPKETVQRKLLDDKEIVLEELQLVFGPRVQFDVVDEGGSPNRTTQIVLGTVIPLIIIIIIIIVVLLTRKTRRKKDSSRGNPRRRSIRDMPNFKSYEMSFPRHRDHRDSSYT